MMQTVIRTMMRSKMRTYTWIIVLLACMGLSSCSKGKAAAQVDAGKSGPAPTSSSVSSSGSADSGAAEKGAKGVRSSDSVKIAAEDQQPAGITTPPVEVRTVPRILTVAGQVQMD